MRMQDQLFRLICGASIILFSGCIAQHHTIETVDENVALTSTYFTWTFPAEGEPKRPKITRYGPNAELRREGHLQSYWACFQDKVFLLCNANAAETLDEDMVEIESACENTFYLSFDYRLEEDRVMGQLHINRFHPYRAYWSMPLELRVGEVAKRTFHPPGHEPVTAVFSYGFPAAFARLDE